MIDTKNLVITTEMVDHYCEQSNFQMTLKLRGAPQSILDFSLFRGEVEISLLMTIHEARRRGYATLLVKELQSQYPDREIRWGFLSTDGQALKNSLSYRSVPAPMARAHRKLDEFKAAYAALGAKIDTMDQLPELSPRERDMRTALLESLSVAERRMDLLQACIGRAPRCLQIVNWEETVTAMEREHETV